MTSTSKICKWLFKILVNLNNFPSFEVVDRVSEKQLRVGENSNEIWHVKGLKEGCCLLHEPNHFLIAAI